MANTGRLSGLPTELGYARHHLPVGEFEDPNDPNAAMDLEADGIIEHFEPTPPSTRGPRPVAGGGASRKIVFICKSAPRYAVHTLLAPPKESIARWKGWLDRYETWSVLVEGHPEFSHRNLRGRRVPAHEEEAVPNVRTEAPELEDASSSFL